MLVTLSIIACVVIYRMARPASSKMAVAQNVSLADVQKRRMEEDRIARLIAILGLIALPIIGSIVVSYGMGLAMSAGSVVSGRELVIRCLVFVPESLGCIALARAQTKLTTFLALPSVAIYFIPALSKNLGL